MSKPTHRGGDPERIDIILARILEQSGLLDGDRQGDLDRAWKEVAGPGVAALTVVQTFRGGTLTVGVKSAPLFQELETFRSDALLRDIRERFRAVHVERIRFRLV